MTWTPAHTVGDTDVDIPAAKRKLAGNSYGKAIGADRSNVYTLEFGKALLQYGINVNADIDAGKRNGPRVTPNAVFDWTVKDQMNVGKYAPPPTPAFRNIDFYSAPGSGAAWWIGPSFDLGQWCKDVLHLNHQPVGFPVGGYMGLMGGDPGLSYNEVIEAEGASLEALLDTNPRLQQALADVNAGRSTDWEGWFSGYSQSAEGMKVAINRLFGEGGKYAPLRSRINGLILFGDPTRAPGPTLYGRNPPGWGISRKVFPKWLNDITWSITAETGAPDFYAACDDEIRPLFYFEVVQAETSLSFLQHIVKVVLPILINSVTSIFGGMANPFGLGLGIVLSTVGLGGPVGDAVTATAHNPTEEEVDKKLTDLFTLKGIITNIPALFRLLGSLAGIQSHGEYWMPKPEFGGLSGVDFAKDIIARFKR